MKAELLIHDKVKDKHGGIIETKIWSVPKSPEKPHGYKYSLVYIKHGRRVLGYDNAEGKGDHRHYMGNEYPYKFQSLEKLWKDFKKDIQRFKEDKS